MKKISLINKFAKTIFVLLFAGIAIFIAFSPSQNSPLCQNVTVICMEKVETPFELDACLNSFDKLNCSDFKKTYLQATRKDKLPKTSRMIAESQICLELSQICLIHITSPLLFEKCLDSFSKIGCDNFERTAKAALAKK